MLGLLSLYMAVCFPYSCPPMMVFIVKNRSISASSSRSEFVIVPLGCFKDTMLFWMSAGHGIQNTVGGVAVFAPITMPPTLCINAFVIPTMSGHPMTRLWHGLDDEIDSHKKMKHS